MFEEKCVKITLFFVSLLLLAGCVVSIVFGFIARNNPIYGIVGVALEVDLQQIVFIFCLVAGIVLLFVMACGMGTATKRYCFLHYTFGIFLSLVTVLFIILGVAMTAIGFGLADQLQELCSSENTDSDFQEAMNELYFRCDTFYCTVLCPCYIGSTLYFTGKTAATINPYDNTKVQDCRQYIQAAYSTYNLEFSDIDHIVEFLDYFGEIEMEYKCSGICKLQTVYYFGDSSRGEPPKTCKDPIREDLLIGEMGLMGIGYLIIGVALFVVLFVQYGLCCREKDDRYSEDDSSRKYDGSRYENPKPYAAQRAQNYEISQPNGTGPAYVNNNPYM
ncbi:unnamed protein product [Moneuplotes crassus]|uniref:Tetraspanin n=1 Tax=Euplotes crassus TaxID=5936 RepID=A0AAD1YAB6_EUPCR|nr:unnamed protein product [Moneuplotes crassus]